MFSSELRGGGRKRPELGREQKSVQEGRLQGTPHKKKRGTPPTKKASKSADSLRSSASLPPASNLPTKRFPPRRGISEDYPRPPRRACERCPEVATAALGDSQSRPPGGRRKPGAQSLGGHYSLPRSTWGPAGCTDQREKGRETLAQGQELVLAAPNTPVVFPPNTIGVHFKSALQLCSRALPRERCPQVSKLFLSVNLCRVPHRTILVGWWVCQSAVQLRGAAESQAGEELLGWEGDPLPGTTSWEGRQWPVAHQKEL